MPSISEAVSGGDVARFMRRLDHIAQSIQRSLSHQLRNSFCRLVHFTPMAACHLSALSRFKP
jgi:hypothetical protein